MLFYSHSRYGRTADAVLCYSCVVSVRYAGALHCRKRKLLPSVVVTVLDHGPTKTSILDCWSTKRKLRPICRKSADWRAILPYHTPGQLHWKKLLLHYNCLSNLSITITMKIALRDTQTLRAGCSKAEPKFFVPLQTPFPGAQDGQNLISWRWSLPSPIDSVWWRSMHAISSYRGNRPTNTHTQTDRTDYNTLIDWLIDLY